LSGRGLCDELIARPEESYRVCCVVVCDLETSRIGAPYIYDISSLRVVLVGKPEEKKPLGRPRRRWEDNIRMDLQEVGGARGDWMELAQDRDRWRALVGTVMNFRVP